MKMRRRTGVNGVRENHRDTVVNQGGTAESFGPLSGRKARLFYEKIQGRILPRRNKNREERRGEHYGKRKKTGRIHYGQRSRFLHSGTQMWCAKQNCVIIQE